MSYHLNYQVLSGLKAPIGRPVKRQKLDDLIKLAQTMEVGDAAILSNSEAQSFRTILNALGFDCVTDGYRCEVRGKTLAFKLKR